MSCLTEEETATAKAETRTLDLPEGVPPLHSLYMYIAGSCNLACRHCWIEPDFSPDRSKGKFLKLEWAKKAVVEAKPLGLQSVKLTGGEPLFHPQFGEIVQLIAQERIYITIETNGTLVDDDLARFLKAAGRVRFISVSVDGANAETHEALRGVAGSFEKAVAGIRALVKVGFRPQLICTLHRGNVGEIEDVLRMAEGLGCGSVKFNHVQRMGRGERLIENAEGLDVKEIIDLYKRLLQIHPDKPSFHSSFDIPVAFYPIRALLKNVSKCNIHNILGVLSDGALSICGVGVLIPDLVFGHIARNKIGEIWISNPRLSELRKAVPDKLEGVCRECIHRDLCLGWCIAQNYHEFGKISANHLFCAKADDKGYFANSRKRIAD